ncbi:hypothetical protein FDECE_7195 [Fusarium decemcellulare]|nr:hypothetical protein FDECE_7195 [Fusarium decemcellulare]
MIAAEYDSTTGGIENHLTIKENVPVPSIPAKKPGILVKIFSVSLNPQDYKVSEIPVFGRLALPPPSTPGTDFVGQVYKSTDPDFIAGDLVFGTLSVPERHGTLAEYAIVKKDGIAKVPTSLPVGVDLRHFACLGTAALTMMQALLKASPGSHIFINGGSGGTGTFAVQIAKNIVKAEKITVTCSAVNDVFVRDLGADENIDYRQQNVIDRLVESTNQTGRKFDLVIDNIGQNPDLYWQAHQYLAEDGEFIQIGLPQVSLGPIMNVCKMLVWPTALGGGKRTFRMLIVKTNRKDLEKLGDWVAEGKTKAIISETYSLNQVQQAFAKLKSGNVRGKLVVDVSQDHPTQA